MIPHDGLMNNVTLINAANAAETVLELVDLMNTNNALGTSTPYAGYQVTDVRRKFTLLDRVLTNGQVSACFMIDLATGFVYHADGYGKRGRMAGTLDSVKASYVKANASYDARRNSVL
jgi:hypothetical protein